MVWRWVVVVCLVLLAAWSAYLAAFHYWAAGGPPTPHPEYYRHWGNVFFAATCGLVAFSIALSVANVRLMKKRRPTPAETPSTQPSR
jgi:hypothetical protein